MAAIIDNNTRTLTGALAVIKVNGKAIGRMRGVTVTETFNRAEIRGIGHLTPDEAPALAWNGALQCDFYTIDWDKTKVPKSVLRKTDSLQEFVDTVLLVERGVQVDIFKKVTESTNAQGFKTSSLEIVASIPNLFLTSEGMNIAEGSISGKDQSFVYLDPILGL